jgi:hypothetical protein
VWRKIRGLRVRQKSVALFALFYAAFALRNLTGPHDHTVGVLWAVTAVLWGISSLRKPPSPADRVLGSGPLAPSGTGRFRASGWPPSKDPDDYR